MAEAVELLSGPGGLAGFLRQQQLGTRLAGPSLPLVHRWGSTLMLNPDGTTVARSPRWRQGPAQPRTARPRRQRAWAVLPAGSPGNTARRWQLFAIGLEFSFG
jgi:hypothetical protein